MNRHGGYDLYLFITKKKELFLTILFLHILIKNTKIIIMKSKLKDVFSGVLIGMINSLLGSGGGLITVPYLNSKGLEQRSSQASSTAVILPLCVLSSFLYSTNHKIEFKTLLVYLIPGVIGAVIGGLSLKKIPANFLKIIFSAFMIYAAIRMIFSVN